MGNVSSKADEGGLLYLRDQTRLAVTSCRITNSRNKTLYTILPNSFPATRYSVRREQDDEGVIEYVQDPDTGSGALPNFLLRLSSEDDIYFYFTFHIRQPSAVSSQVSTSLDTTINSLTFVFAPTPKELDTLVTREFNADPNLHRNPNVDLVGDYSTSGSPLEQFEWSWRWRPSKPLEDRAAGWRNTCSFVEYDQRAHRLNTLATFSFWVHGMQRPLREPNSPVFRQELLVPQRTRMPSAQSLESRLSDSDTDAREYREPPSPFEPIPEISTPMEPLVTSSTVKVDINPQRGDEDITAAEDGPIFRATMKSLESRTGSMRMRMKKVLKKAECAKECQTACNAAFSAFMDALNEASSSNANAVQPALDHYFQKIAKEILLYETLNAENLQRLIIDPVARLYSNDIKQAEAKKKDFEEESRDYYAYVSRYLGQRQDSLKEKKRAESDTKYQNKRKNFELRRFDYSSFMQDLHGGRKDQEVLSQLTKYADAQARSYLASAKKIEAMLPQLDALCFEVKEADKEYQLLRSGREEKRRNLEKSSKSYVEPESANATTTIMNPNKDSNVRGTGYENEVNNSAIIPQDNSRFSMSITQGNPPNGMQLEPSITTTTSGQLSSNIVNALPSGVLPIREHENKDINSGRTSTSHRKEGLLWSLSRPGSHADPIGLNKQAWHKFWIVLDQGRLSEYINWKQNLEQHIDPIDLRMASVREARNADRRFCFEVITPNFTRVYQATGEDDMKSWIQAINNALQSAFEGQTVPVGNAPTIKSSGSIARDLFGKSSSYHGHRSSSTTAHVNARTVGRHATVGERPGLNRSRSSEERPTRLLQTIRSSDAGNVWCADCGSDSRVEWVSINLGIVICIECSGIHRSLGTHITKIRSLTLDPASFTQDLIELLLSIGNRVSNMIWEARLDHAHKPNANATRERRLEFITSKYVRKSYLEPLSAATSHFLSPDETLLASIKKNDIRNVVYALALAANPNAADRSRATHAVYLALVAADPASPGSILQAPRLLANQADVSQSRKSFAIAELLLQNGSVIPVNQAPIPLSQSAQLYLDFKKAQKLGRMGSLIAGADIIGTASSRDSERTQKLIKRNSTKNPGLV